MSINVKKLTQLILISTLLYSCTSAEQKRRNLLMDNLALQLTGSQKLLAELMIRVSELETRMGQIDGKFDEFKHQNQVALEEDIKSSINQLKEQANQLQESIGDTQKSLGSVKGQLSEQKDYISKVNATLAKATSKDKNRNLSDYQRSLNLYRGGKYKQSIALMEQVIVAKKTSTKQRAHMYHNLGMAFYIIKDDEKSQIYFGKLFSEYPDSRHNKNGLLYLAKSKRRSKQKDDAKMILQELVKRYPKSNSAKSAKSMLKELK